MFFQQFLLIFQCVFFVNMKLKLHKKILELKTFSVSKFTLKIKRIYENSISDSCHLKLKILFEKTSKYD